MRGFFSENTSQILDGLLFGLGMLAVYLGAVFTGALIRSLGGAGSKGLTFIGRYAQGWYLHLRGDDRDIINVTLNMIVDGELKFDTLVADRRIWFVWPNAYRQQMIRRAARRTSADNPIVFFPDPAAPKGWGGKLRRRCGDAIHHFLASVKVVHEGKMRRVRIQREDDYKSAYGPLVSLVSEKCNNDAAIELALGRPMEEHRFVVAITFEKLSDRRARHLRAMVIWEPMLRSLPAECPRVEREEHRTRFKTLQAIARHYAARPQCFGIVYVWRPKEVSPIVPAEMGRVMLEPRPAE